MCQSPPTPRPGESALFLDVDGTLLGIRNNPAAVVSDDALRTLLLRLNAASGSALALVSGRTLAELDRIFAPLALTAAGTHGGEIRHGDDDLSPPGLTHFDAADLAPLNALVAANPGLLLEHKGVSVTVHYRERPELEAECRDVMEALHTRDPDNTVLIAGKMVFELTPRLANKGAAIERLLAEAPFAGRTPVFIGDDTTDEAGFAVVNDRGGVSVRVGARDGSLARYQLADVAAVHGWLAAIADCGAD